MYYFLGEHTTVTTKRTSVFLNHHYSATTFFWATVTTLLVKTTTLGSLSVCGCGCVNSSFSKYDTYVHLDYVDDDEEEERMTMMTVISYYCTWMLACFMPCAFPIALALIPLHIFYFFYFFLYHIFYFTPQKHPSFFGQPNFLGCHTRNQKLLHCSDLHTRIPSVYNIKSLFFTTTMPLLTRYMYAYAHIIHVLLVCIVEDVERKGRKNLYMGKMCEPKIFWCCLPIPYHILMLKIYWWTYDEDDYLLWLLCVVAFLGLSWVVWLVSLGSLVFLFSSLICQSLVALCLIQKISFG